MLEANVLLSGTAGVRPRRSPVIVVTPAGTAHSSEVLGNEPAGVVCIDSPPTAKLDG